MKSQYLFETAKIRLKEAILLEMVMHLFPGESAENILGLLEEYGNEAHPTNWV
ncbi:MAG: hypothetical protein SFY67_03380 [Candidatus Melainabacteria bacterium]|nr:hypothetical protein [Candidatus Melainabacteria bacterium]